jgi:hypothetical protein
MYNMRIAPLTKKINSAEDAKTGKLFDQFSQLIAQLNLHQLTPKATNEINEGVARINNTISSGNALHRLIKQTQTAILKTAEKENKIVPKKHYARLGMLLGTSAIGLPIGVAFGTAIGNMGLLGLGLPIGMAIGAAIGNGLDKKAMNEGRQLDLEIKY